MWEPVKRGALLLLLAGTLLPVIGQAQSTPSDSSAGDNDKAIRLRQQIEETRKKLADLEGQLAAEEQKKQEEEAAAEEKRRQQQLAAEDKSATAGAGRAAAGKRRASTSFHRAHLRPQHRLRSKSCLDKPAAHSLERLAYAVSVFCRDRDHHSQRHFHRETLAPQPDSDSTQPKLFQLRPCLPAWRGRRLVSVGQEDEGRSCPGNRFPGQEAVVDSLLDAEAHQIRGRTRAPAPGQWPRRILAGRQLLPVGIHAAAAWSVASIIAHEYPGTLTQLLAYGAASGVSAARIIGRQHFTSDVLVGGALGWYSGWQVYHAHHSPELNGAEWGTFERSHEPMKARDMGSPYVPLDSWVYPVFDRLVAMGYVQTGFAGLKPWTRMECARLVAEAGTLIQEQGLEGGETVRLYRELTNEFGREVGLLEGGSNLGAEVESVYSRSTVISGPPLTDGYHFGQTLYNDFGRPYAEGFNQVTGVSARSEAGPLAFYFRGEYQHAPAPAVVPDECPGCDRQQRSRSPAAGGGPGGGQPFPPAR